MSLTTEHPTKALLSYARANGVEFVSFVCGAAAWKGSGGTGYVLPARLDYMPVPALVPLLALAANHSYRDLSPLVSTRCRSRIRQSD